MITVHDVCASIGRLISIIVVIGSFLVAVEITLFILECLEEDDPDERDRSSERFFTLLGSMNCDRA